MGKIRDKSAAYGESDIEGSNRTLRPIPAPGIGHRIGQVAKLIGTRTSAYEVMGVSSAALQRYIKEENEPPFGPLARLCVAAGASLNWLATGEGDMRTQTGAVREEPAQWPSDEPSQAVRHEELTIALQLAAEALGEKELPPAKHAELVTLIYELLVEGLPEAKVLRFARAFAA
jgi:hypothetical protein